jgi:GntR family transcriptional regulator
MEQQIMQITIDIDSTVPMFTQLIDQIKAAVQAGQVTPGAALPSIRQLANDLDLNNKTVAKAYRLLERDSIIESKGYRGTFVHPDAVDNCNIDLNGWVHSTMVETIEKIRKAGATDSEIRVAFTNVMNKRNGGEG